MVLEIFFLRAAELLFYFFRQNSLNSPSQTSYSFCSIIPMKSQMQMLLSKIWNHTKRTQKKFTEIKMVKQMYLHTHKPSNNACCGVEKGGGWVPLSCELLATVFLILLIPGYSVSLSLQSSLALQFSCIISIWLMFWIDWPHAPLRHKKTRDAIYQWSMHLHLIHRWERERSKKQGIARWRQLSTFFFSFSFF